ncbi:MAG: N-acetyltransferase [Thermodesulfobacteriota bacterium]
MEPEQWTREITLQEVKDQRGLLRFIRFLWKLYQGDPQWVPPLIKDHLKKFSPQHPFLSHAQMKLLLALRGGDVVGRIAGIIDHHYVQFQEEKVGFFGFFESIKDSKVGKTLFHTVKIWLKSQGMEKMIGPMNPSTNDECGLLIEGFDSPPCLMMPYNPPYYPLLIEEVGLKKAMDLYAYLLEKDSFRFDRLDRITERIKRTEPHLSVRTIQMRKLNEELKIIKEIYNQAWSRNWGFVPMTEEEIDELAKNLKPLAVSDLVLFAYWKDEPVGFSVALPDYNVVLRHLNGKLGPLGVIKFFYYSKKIKKIRVLLLGVKKEFQKRGVEGLLYIETFKRGIQKGYQQAECSWILETNLLMQHGIEAMGGRKYKIYRIYESSL